MTVPPENYAAFFPAPRYIGGRGRVGPLTLAHVVRLARIGIDLSRSVPRSALADAARILGAGRWVFNRSSLASAVEATLNDAFETLIPPRAEATGAHAPERVTPHGLGWPLECAEFLCAEYGWSFAEAINTPVATAFALVAAARERKGGKNSFDYLERRYIADLKAGRIKPFTIDNGKEQAV